MLRYIYGRKSIISVLMATMIFALLFFISISRWSSTASADGWNNYTVVTQSGQFKGVNIKDSTEGTLSVCIPTGSDTVPAVAGEHGAGMGLVTFEIGQVDPSASDGILIQIDRRHATANQGPRFFIEAQDGTLYRFSDGTARDDVFIKSDDSVSTMKSENSHRYTMTSGILGTLYVPWSVMTATGTSTKAEGTPPAVTSHIAAGTIFTRLHYALDMRSNGWHGENRATAFGTIATVDVDGEVVTVTKLLGVASLTYSNDPSDLTCDVNLADITKGQKVYSRHSISEVFVFDETPDVVAATIDIYSWTRTSVSLTVNYVDADGNQLMNPSVSTLSYNAQTGNFPYTVTAPQIAGYEFDDQSSAALTGSVNGTASINLVYNEIPAPVLTARYVDESGQPIKASEPLFVEFDSDTLTATYDITPANIFGYKYVSADKPLQGTFSEDMVITLTYSLKEYNFDVITGTEGEFVGVNLKKTLTGALVVDVIAIDSSTGYGLVTVELDNVNPFESTGFLLQYARLNANNAQVRMFIEAEDGTMYRFFSGPENAVPAREDVVIKPDGSILYLTNDSTNHRHMFTGEGTLYIPWNKVFKVGDDTPIVPGTVFTKFHFGREMRYDTSLNKPIAIGFIGGVKVDGDNVMVDEFVDLTRLTYTSDDEEENADVNLGDYQLGKTVYVSHWATGTHLFDTNAQTFETILGLFKLTRMPPQITLNFVDESGNTIKDSMNVTAEYSEGGSTYAITPPSIVGYSFKLSDKPLQGTSDVNIEITLTYSVVSYKITLEFRDEDGNVIKEAREISAQFGSYQELEADEVEGYTFKESTSPLAFTVMNEKTIVLYYTKNQQKGCKTSIADINIALAAGALAVFALLYLRAKSKKQ